ncbi:16S rRNA (cytosine(1402)-N(4))-methyltransferase [hydrothermal vent metagenome]|uniref:16S rRNA (Cytosine(1402)-N(4))-methyltransferase n=1 Tax=hydrothermal vent metagenome TaxID=652676 RepID=A0A3B0ZH91_9ZZZZ
MSEFSHYSVLLHEAVDSLNIQPDGVYIDGTFGRGGHSVEILKALGPQGRLIGFDKDDQAVAAAAERFGDDSRFTMIKGSFASMGEQLAAMGLAGKVNGIFLDLGVSSPQIDDAARGFSFRLDGPLDMRMASTGISAAEWIASVERQDLADAIREYGEERFAWKIAGAIVAARDEAAIETTGQLADIIRTASPTREHRIDAATRSFQGIRIYINRELDDLKDCLEQIFDLLVVGGRLSVISFHSLEDRIVKHFIREHAKADVYPRGLPVRDDEMRKPPLKAIGKAVKASKNEIAENVRSRSAVMRTAEKQ